MTGFSRILSGAAGLGVALAAASPAAAQSYPYGGGNNGVVGAIINSVTGNGVYGSYPQGNYGYGQGYGQGRDRIAVDQCARATEQRLNANYRGHGNYRPGYGGGYDNGYGNGYGNAYQGEGARVVGITHVERRSNGGLKVSGVADSGRKYYSDRRGYDNRGGYDQRGYDQRGYDQRGYDQRGYDQRGYDGAVADLRFSCRVNYRGQVTDLQIDRQRPGYRRGY